MAVFFIYDYHMKDSNFSLDFKRFFLRHSYFFIFLSLILFVVVFSYSPLLNKPRLWTDEAVSIDIARSFLDYGVLSPQIAPDTFYEFPHLIQSTGYPVTVSLATFFKLFGYGLYQARIFMLIWILATLATLYISGCRIFGKRQTVLAILLFISFASFYGSGRTVVGEIPGFIFLILGLYIAFTRSGFFWSGIFWGLAVVTKPSVFGLIIPTVFLTLLFERAGWRIFLRKLFMVAVGMIPAGVGWVLLVVENPFLSSTWKSLGTFYSNPYSSSIRDNVVQNLLGVFHSTTLIYFGLLFVIIVFARVKLKDIQLKSYFSFTIIYSILAFAYYLRSPGWLRYILIAELLILFLLPYAVERMVEWVRDKRNIFTVKSKLVTNIFVLILVTVQFVQLFTVADLFSSDAGLPTAQYVNEHFPDKSVSFLNALDVSISVDSKKRFNTFELTGMPLFGTNTLFLQDLPEVIIGSPDDRFIKVGEDVLDNKYTIDAEVGGYTIYTKK